MDHYSETTVLQNKNLTSTHSHVSMLISSSAIVTPGFSYDLSIAARKLSLQPRPLTIWDCGLWTLIWPFNVASATAVWRLSRELDFFRPREGPTTCSAEPMERGKSVTEASGPMACDLNSPTKATKNLSSRSSSSLNHSHFASFIWDDIMCCTWQVKRRCESGN